METIAQYARIITAFLAEHQGESDKSLLITDHEHHHYQLVYAGWDSRNHYLYRVRIHLQIKPDGHICLLENKTDIDVAEELVAKGIPRTAIELSFLPETVRPLAGYAA